MTVDAGHAALAIAASSPTGPIRTVPSRHRPPDPHPRRAGGTPHAQGLRAAAHPRAQRRPRAVAPGPRRPLWPDTFVEAGNLSFQMSGLRKALGDERERWVVTVPKVGYRFAGEVTADESLMPAPRAALDGSRLPDVDAVQWHAAPEAAVGRRRLARRPLLWLAGVAVVAASGATMVWRREAPVGPLAPIRDGAAADVLPGMGRLPELLTRQHAGGLRMGWARRQQPRCLRQASLAPATRYVCRRRRWRSMDRRGRLMGSTSPSFATSSAGTWK
jgi:hypothetical protein